jgi:hypothetical protein
MFGRALLVTWLLTAVSVAQTPLGSIRGTVQDTTGARISSATITLRLNDSSLERNSQSGDHGDFRIDDLPPGEYRVTATAAGFSRAQASVRVQVSSVRNVTITLRPTAASETVTVEAKPSSVTTQPRDVGSAVHQGIVSSHYLQMFPLANRSFANIAYLVPGTEPVEPSDPTKARITAVSTGGSSGLNNELSVDGADNSDDYIGGFLQNFSPESISEFAVRTANEEADTGGTTAASIVITTKRGNNDWHGTGAFMNARLTLMPASRSKIPRLTPHAIDRQWTVGGDYTYEQGNHAYRGYSFPLPSTDFSVFKSDNRSSYNALMLRVQGNMSRFSVVANYTLASAKTWGCLIGELFDYVNGVCGPFHAFAPGDYGPSGEDVRHRFVLAGTARIRGGIEFATLTQLESARPLTLTTPAGDRAVINGVKTTLDEFRGTPFMQVDLCVSRPIRLGENNEIRPFAEFFNLFNRNNPGNNYITDISALPTGVNDLSNAIAICSNPPSCTIFVPITSPRQLLFPAGALGDFFGPDTTVGTPFAAQLGVRVSF